MSKPEIGQIVDINIDPTGIEFAPKEAEVVDVLSVQFTARWLDGTDTLSFRFFDEEGYSWRHKDE